MYLTITDIMSNPETGLLKNKIKELQKKLDYLRKADKISAKDSDSHELEALPDRKGKDKPATGMVYTSLRQLYLTKQ